MPVSKNRRKNGKKRKSNRTTFKSVKLARRFVLRNLNKYLMTRGYDTKFTDTMNNAVKKVNR
jgi:hypothetical protein